MSAAKEENGYRPQEGHDSSQNGGNEADNQVLSNQKLFMVTCSISISYFLVLLNSTVVVTTIPSLTSSFNSTQDVGWKQYVFLCFMGVFELGSLLCGVATSSPMFIIGRAVAGLGAAGITSGAMTIVATTAPRPKRPYITGFAMAVGSMGQVTGPLVGGVLTQYVSWRWSFYINLPLGGATALLILFIKIPDQRDKTRGKRLMEALHELDLVGFAIVCPAVVMFLLALNWGGNTYPWRSATIIGLFCGAVLATCIFIGWEWHKGREAMIPLYMLRHRLIASCLWTGFLQSGAIVEMTYFLPIWFQAVRGDSATMSGVNLMATVGSQIFFAAMTGLLVSKVGYPLPFALFGSSCLAIGAGLMSTLTPSANVGPWVGYQILTGAGRGIVQQLPIGVVQAALTGEEIAVGTSILAFVQYLGAAIFISGANSLFSNKLITALQIMVPEIDAAEVLKSGAAELIKVVPAAYEPQILLAYSKAVTSTFYLAAAAGAATLFTSMGFGLINIKK
ncbi:hypothetical protein EKO04_005149 [Ascochyta lentis]|uniref:Major facilitator superfamily (MFS) profile domain-containing protein n=1 Tax=Ascochyta lentis TaxID=205686 RepID=A0A8H7J546_9PLEO|nr:hypothetical protein EKO04_005149 [Ascochyta lentis]